MAALVEALASAARAELAACVAADGEARRDGLPPGAVAPQGFDGDGPVFVIGCCALVQATWTVIGEDPLQEVIDLLAPLLDGALAGCGQVVTEALVVALSDHHACEQPGDLEVLGCLRDETHGQTPSWTLSRRGWCRQAMRWGWAWRRLDGWAGCA